MAEIFYKSKIFKEYKKNVHYESDFEELVRKHLIEFTNKRLGIENSLVCREMKYQFSSPYGLTKPDLIIFDRQYTNYWIVEVELATHRWDHVYPQMTKITNADYSGSAFEMLEHIKREGTNDVDEKKFLELIEMQTPRFLLVINDRPTWYEEYVISELEFEYIEMKVYRNEDLDTLYSISGNSLDLSEIEAVITPSASKKFFELSKNTLLSEFKDNKTIKVVYKNHEFSLSIVNNKKQCLLFAHNDDNLSYDHAYKLSKSKDQEVYLMTRLYK